MFRLQVAWIKLGFLLVDTLKLSVALILLVSNLIRRREVSFRPTNTLVCSPLLDVNGDMSTNSCTENESVVMEKQDQRGHIFRRNEVR